MSKYTTEVRYICEVNSGLDESADFNDVDNVINASYDKIFNFDFPIFDENYRQVLEKKILLHYYTREIGLETVGLWKLKLMTKMREIMPYYNQLYKSELFNFNPFYDTDLTRRHEGTKDDAHTGNDVTTTTQATNVSESIESAENETGTSGYDKWDKFSDTPQGTLLNVRDDLYLTSARENTDSSNFETDRTSTNERTGNTNVSGNGTVSYNSNINTTEQYVEYVTGKNGGESYSKRLIEFRKTFLNIDMQVINDLKDLFMYVW